MNMKCPVCEHETRAEIISVYKEYKLHHCIICDTMFWLPMKGIPGEIYDTYNVAGALTYLNLRAIPWAHKRFFEDLPNKGGKLLEIGCSSGEFLQKARKAGYLVTGIDSSAETAGFAQSHYRLKDVFPFTIQELMASKPDEKYDVIALFQVLEHIDDVPDFIRCIKKLLKPGGIVVISVPNRNRWRVKSERFFREAWDLPPAILRVGMFRHWKRFLPVTVSLSLWLRSNRPGCMSAHGATLSARNWVSTGWRKYLPAKRSGNRVVTCLR